jgi:hypothetical protein
VDGIPNPLLDVGDGLSGAALVTSPIKSLGGDAELDDQILRKISWGDLAALFPR